MFPLNISVPVCFRASEDLVKWQEKAVPVTEYSVKAAVDWLYMLDHLPAVYQLGPIEALMEAVCDDTVIFCIFPEVFN